MVSRLRSLLRFAAPIIAVMCTSLLVACQGVGGTPLPSPTPAPTLTPLPMTAQETELVRNTMTATLRLKSYHATIGTTLKDGASNRLEIDYSATSNGNYFSATSKGSYMRGEVDGKHVERLYLQGSKYKYMKDASGQWVEFTGVDKDLQRLLTFMIMSEALVTQLTPGSGMNSQTSEPLEGTIVQRFFWDSGKDTTTDDSMRLDVWVDPNTGFMRKIILCVSEPDLYSLCGTQTQSKQNVEVDILKLAGGTVPPHQTPTP